MPGGRLTTAHLAVLAKLADSLGDGALEATSRANLQIRGLPEGAELELAAALAAAGLFPSPAHEKVRNIVASPLGPPDLARELDAALCAAPELADLPGRFLFCVDDGGGDVAWLGADVTVLSVPTGAEPPGVAEVAVTARPHPTRYQENPGPRDTPEARATSRETPPTTRSVQPRGDAFPLPANATGAAGATCLPAESSEADASPRPDPLITNTITVTPTRGAVPDGDAPAAEPGARLAAAHLSSPSPRAVGPLPGPPTAGSPVVVEEARAPEAALGDRAVPVRDQGDHAVPFGGSPTSDSRTTGTVVPHPANQKTAVQRTAILSGPTDNRAGQRLPVDSSGLCGRRGPDFRYAVLLGGVDHGLRADRDEVVAVALACAREFLAVRDGQWRVAELGDRAREIARRVAATTHRELRPDRVRAGRPSTTGPIGPVVFAGGEPGFGVAIPLGRLTAAQARALAATGRDVVLTPWRGLVVSGDGAGLAELGLLTDPSAPGVGVTACAGQPQCRKALADVRAMALATTAPGGPVHWSGCGRRCGRPVGEVLDVVATEDGYLVDGRAVSGERVTTAVALGRQEQR
ncbi:nitrite/sulfite reductase ferredoxin-like protein [Actinokineospora auranticolor]|uniref:Nitrite/sulfite reductase ferredoxin-like protein n=1 Tax=Actinokineospora auranticolor TaxID=155976 RepID=A0A2S6H0F4_9PSEU|nr:nitrite/sulfite reductase ferredoxin-like protein [Actinokineospora auranticolor]